MRWSNDEPNVITSLMDAPERRSNRGVAILLASLLVGVLFAGWIATAEAQERYTPTSRGEIRALAFERAEVHGANGWVVVAVAECESSLNPYAIGDGGTSFGIAQLSSRAASNNLLGHFYSLGYTRWWSAWEALDYLSRAMSGEFLNAEWGRIGAHRWSCWRLLFGGGL